MTFSAAARRRSSVAAGLLAACMLAHAGPPRSAAVRAEFQRLNPCPSRLTKDGWHYFIGALVALFSVPTVLIVSVLRAVRRPDKDPGADSLHAAVGEKVTALVEKIVDKIMAK